MDSRPVPATRQPTRCSASRWARCRRRIKETGLFPSAPDLSKHPRPPDRVRARSAAVERRHGEAALPAAARWARRSTTPTGTKWEFPVGTIFIKTLLRRQRRRRQAAADRDPLHPPGERRATSPYDYYVYKWNADGTDATLVVDDIEGDPDEGRAHVMITIKRTVERQAAAWSTTACPSRTTLPSRNAVRRLPRRERDGGPDLHRLRRDPAQLQAHRHRGQDPAAGARGRGHLHDGHARPRRRPSPTPRTTAVACCGSSASCSATASTATTAAARFDMRPDVFVENTVEQGDRGPEREAAPGLAARRSRQDPTKQRGLRADRAHDAAAAHHVDGQDDRLRPMPPVGVADMAVDQAALADVRAWIMSLPAPAPVASERRRASRVPQSRPTLVDAVRRCRRRSAAGAVPGGAGHAAGGLRRQVQQLERLPLRRRASGS